MVKSVDESHRKLLKRRRELAKRPEAKAKKAAYMKEFRKRGYCKRPHVLAKKKAYNAEYYKRPEAKERAAARSRKYYGRPEVKAKRRAYRREYYRRPEARMKRLESKKRYRMRPATKVRQKEHNRKWQQRNPGWNKKSMDRFRRMRITWLSDLKSKTPCSICHRSFPDHPSVIEFHHESTESKEAGISQMKLRSLSEVEAEIGKCVAVCANCHRIIHQKKSTRREGPPLKEMASSRQRWYSELKAAQVCSVCGETYPDNPSVIEFHHKGDSKKEGEISSWAKKKTIPLSQVQAEIDKCIVVCANCHRIVHDLERRNKRVLHSQTSKNG